MRVHFILTAARAPRRPLVAVPAALCLAGLLAATGASATADAAGPAPGAPALAGTWKRLPAAPVSRLPDAMSSVWTGRQMIIHGAFPSPVTFAYRPATGRWARLRPGPKPLTLEASDVAVWTGSRMLVMGLTNGSYNPATNTWRPIARLIMPDEGAVVGWTGRIVILWGGVCCDGLSNAGSAYRPSTNRWQRLPAAPLRPRRSAAGAWTGKALIVAGGVSEAPNSGPRAFRDAAAYNPLTRTWRKLAPMPAGRWGAAGLWDGRELLVIGGWVRAGADQRLATRGLAYNPAANRWRWLPVMPYPRSGSAAVWTGRQVLVWGGLTAARIPPPHGEAYDPAANRWTALPPAPLAGRGSPAAVWTGRRMIVWGGQTDTRTFTDGAAFTPAAASWGKAIQVPGLAALNKGGDAVRSMSCTSAGSCAAGGGYTDRHGKGLGFVASERNGRWGTVIKMPSPVSSVSCASAGNCAAGGQYPGATGSLGFVASELRGVWGRAITVPGLAALRKGHYAAVSSVSCGSPGNCAAVGYYQDRRSSASQQGFVAVQRNGVWSKAIEVPGLAALNTGRLAEVNSVSCASASSCAAGGDYTNQAGNTQGFVAVERDSRWGKAIELPGLAALNKWNAAVLPVSCGSAGNCAAGGYYIDRHGYLRGFVADERNGRWGQAIEVPGLGALNASGEAEVLSLSCGAAGTCAAGGAYVDRHDHSQGFVASEHDGVWGRAIQVPGLAALNHGDAGVLSVSCAPAGSCAAGGYYSDRSHHHQGFVTQAR